MRSKFTTIIFIIIIFGFCLTGNQMIINNPACAKINILNNILKNELELQTSAVDWTTTNVISTESINDSVAPSLVVDASGNVHITWHDDTDYGDAGADNDIFYKFWNATTNIWSGTVNITDVVSTESTGNSYSPSLAVDSSGNIHVAWYEDSDYGGSGVDWDVFYKFWNATTGIWSGNINSTDVVSTESTGFSSRPSLAVNGSGNVYIAWQDNTNYTGANTDYDIFAKLWNATAGVWYITYVLSTESTVDSEHPSIAVDDSGNMHVVWDDETDYADAGPNPDIFYKFWNATTNVWNGTINATDVVSTESTGFSLNPSIAVDSLGNIHVGWQDYTNYSGSGGEGDIFYKFWNATTGIWNGNVNASDVVSTESTVESREPSLAVDSSGNVHLVWHDLTPNRIFYKFWNANASIWTGNVNTTDMVSTESTASSNFPSVAVDGSGFVHVAWHDTTNYRGAGTDIDIFYKRLINIKAQPSEDLSLLLLLMSQPADIILPIALGAGIGAVILIIAVIMIKKRK